MWAKYLQLLTISSKLNVGVEVKRFGSDNANDYFNQFLTPYFEKQGIMHESSCECTQQKVVAEWKSGRQGLPVSK